MRNIITTTFITMDGVMQAPGGPQEDTAGGFAFGGWQMKYGDPTTDKLINTILSQPFEMLLGRFTYDIFAAYWPNHPEIAEVAGPFNATRKYVVSHNLFEPVWNNSVCVSGDVVAEIRKLKEQDGPDLWVWGSGNLIQTLLANNLVDRMHLWIHPLTIGSGKKLFAEGTQPTEFRLVSGTVSESGIVCATYEPSGILKVGQT